MNLHSSSTKLLNGWTQERTNKCEDTFEDTTNPKMSLTMTKTEKVSRYNYNYRLKDGN